MIIRFYTDNEDECVALEVDDCYNALGEMSLENRLAINQEIADCMWRTAQTQRKLTPTSDGEVIFDSTR